MEWIEASLYLTVGRATQTKTSSDLRYLAIGFLTSVRLCLRDPESLIGVMIVQPGSFLTLITKYPI